MERVARIGASEAVDIKVRLRGMDIA